MTTDRDEDVAWEMWAGTNLHGFCNIDADRTYPVLYGHPEPLPVLALSRDDGDYLGWVPAGDTVPVMIQRPMFFEMQFTYGSSAEVERGRGRVVRLAVTGSTPKEVNDG